MPRKTRSALRRRKISRSDRTRARPTGGPTCIDLFAGAGGLAEGFRQAGWSVLSGVDLDPFAAETFRANFPAATFFEGPISALDPGVLLVDGGLTPGELDCLIGGPPCQSFSYNNHQRSSSGARARLFEHYLRIVDRLRPKSLVMENVPGILTIGNGAVIRQIQKSLEALGYESDLRIMFSEDFGVPQERRRVFIVATRFGWDDALFPPGTHGPCAKPSEQANPFVHRWRPTNGARRPDALTTVWEAIGDLPVIANGGGRQTAPYSDVPGRKPMTDYQRRMRGSCKRLHNHVARVLQAPVEIRVATVPEGGDWRDIPRRLLPDGMKRARPNDHTKRYGRLRRGGLCCTILTKCDPHWGSYVHPTQNRAISVREAARLQSFPDSFRFKGPLVWQYAQVGNAVPPMVAKALGRAVKLHVRTNS